MAVNLSRGRWVYGGDIGYQRVYGTNIAQHVNNLDEYPPEIYIPFITHKGMGEYDHLWQMTSETFFIEMVGQFR